MLKQQKANAAGWLSKSATGITRFLKKADLSLCILISVLWLAQPSAVAADDCAWDRADLRGSFGKLRFSVEVMDTEETRAQGLMFRESLPRYSGMLFVYDRPEAVNFWMKNTVIPLDMVFLNEYGRVVYIHENAIPRDLTPIFGGRDIKMVLEINGGLARRLGLSEGVQMRHPAFDQGKAQWPCKNDQ